jgi:hypothetical protein
VLPLKVSGTISELLAQNGIPRTIKEHMHALESLGGLGTLGGPKTDPMYHAGWAPGGKRTLGLGNRVAHDWRGNVNLAKQKAN